MVRLFYCRLQYPFNSLEWSVLLDLLPQAFHKKAQTFHRWQDAHAFVAGKLLLQNGLRAMGMTSLSLDDIRYTDFMRPYLQDDVDFNISHSGQFVVCAISQNTRLGIDIEEIRPLDLSDFKSQWTEEEWTSIVTAESSIHRFYEYWTRKEAVIKADGRGLNIPLKHIDVREERSLVNGTLWYLQQIFLDEGHILHLAANRADPVIEITEINLAASVR